MANAMTEMATLTVTETVTVTASCTYAEKLAYASLINTWAQAFSHLTKSVVLGAVMVAAYINSDAITAFIVELCHGRGVVRVVSERQSVDSEDEPDDIR